MPAPTRLTPVALIALCRENMPKDCLCVKIRLLNLPVPTPSLPLLSSSLDDGPTPKQPKFSAAAQPHCPPVTTAPKASSPTSCLSKAMNDLWHVSLLSPLSLYSLPPVFLPSPMNAPTCCLSPPSLKPTKSCAWARHPWPLDTCKRKMKGNNITDTSHKHCLCKPFNNSLCTMKQYASTPAPTAAHRSAAFNVLCIHIKSINSSQLLSVPT